MDTADEEKLYDIRQTVGMVFQNPDNQIVATVVEEDVAFALENLGVPQDEADDTGGAIVGNRIDLGMDDREEALNFGRQNVVVHVL